MKPTAKQVAHAANVSISAVSRAFLPGAPIAEGKRTRILAVAAEVGYVSPARRTAEAIAAGTVSLVTGDLANPFYPLVLESLAKTLQAKGQQLLVYALPEGATVDSTIEQIIAARPRAVIVTSAHLTSNMAVACRKHGIRIILFNRTQLDVRVDAIACDNYAGGRDVAELLISRDHRKIGFVGGLATTSTHVERARGFRERLNEEGRDIYAQADGAFNYQIAYAAATSLLAGSNPPDALFCCNDLMALAAIDAAKERGMSVPGDLAVAGFDDIPMAAWNSYQLTTIRQPLNRMIQETVNLVEEGEVPAIGDGVVRILPGRLIIRASA